MRPVSRILSAALVVALVAALSPLLGAGAAGAAGSAGAGVAGGAPERSGGPGELIVAFEPAVAASAAAERAHDEAGAEAVSRIPELALHVVEVDDVDDALAEYARKPGVRYAEVDATVTAAGTDDPLFEHQWHLRSASSSNRGTANVEPAWSTSKGSGVAVAVLDTGVERGGSDLATSRLLSGHDFVNGDDDASDDHGHGTHIAGTVAQSTGNEEGGAGVAPRAEILPVKVLDQAGAGTYSDVIDGILWAKERADVLNLSLSGATHSDALCDAVSKAAAAGAVVVSASGNDGRGSVSYPAACDDALAVGAVRFDGQRTGYSNAGPELDLVAPGGDLDVDQDGDGYQDGILQQTWDGSWGFSFFEGTSMAAAHASGVAALLLGKDGEADVASVLAGSARDLGPDGRDGSYGWGAVDAAAALDRLSGSGSGPAPDPEGYWLASDGGRVMAFGDATRHGSVAGNRSATVAIEARPDGGGYWLLDRSGQVTAFGAASDHGSVADLRASGTPVGTAPALDIAATPSGGGYWILDASGGIFTFGDAAFHGSVPDLRRQGLSIGRATVIDIAATPSGEGYWILDAAGGMFSFGDADFHGSVPGLRRAGHGIGRARIAGMAPSGSGRGYWLADRAGGMFAFGDAGFHGSIPGLRAAGHTIGRTEVVAMEPSGAGDGYWLVDHRGGIFTFGGASYHGSFPSAGVSARAVGIAPVRAGG